MPKYRCVVATPTRELFSGDIDYANIPGVEGNYGVLSGHEQFLGLNRPGLLTITVDEGTGDKRVFMVYKGMAQMFNNHLSILAQLGREFDEIDVEDTRKKLEAAKADLAEIQREWDEGDDAQIKTRTDYIEWCELQIKAKEQGML